MALLRKIIYILIIFFPLLELGKINLIKGVLISINDFFAGLIFVLFIALLIFQKIKIRDKLWVPIISFFGIALFSLIINLFNYSYNHILISSLYLIRWLSYASLYLIVANYSNDIKRKIQKLMFFSGVTILVIGFLQFLFYKNLVNLYYLQWDEHLYRLFGTFFDPNFAGAFFALFTIYLFGFIISEKSKNKRIFFGIIALLSILAVSLTYSRSAMLMLFFSIIAFLILIKKNKYILVFILFLLISVVLSPKAFQTEGTNFFRTYSSMERVKSAKTAIDIFSKNPIFGVGFNTYRYAQYKYGYLTDQKWEITHSGAGTDNSFLFLLATTGIAGFTVFINLLRKIFLLLFSKSKKNTIMDRKWKIVAASSLIGLIINSFFINSFFYPPIMLWMWLIISFTKNN